MKKRTPQTLVEQKVTWQNFDARMYDSTLHNNTRMSPEGRAVQFSDAVRRLAFKAKSNLAGNKDTR